MVETSTLSVCRRNWSNRVSRSLPFVSVDKPTTGSSILVSEEHQSSIFPLNSQLHNLSCISLLSHTLTTEIQFQRLHGEPLHRCFTSFHPSRCWYCWDRAPVLLEPMPSHPQLRSYRTRYPGTLGTAWRLVEEVCSRDQKTVQMLTTLQSATRIQNSKQKPLSTPNYEY